MSKKILLFFILMLTILTLGTPALASDPNETVTTIGQLTTAIGTAGVKTITIDGTIVFNETLNVKTGITLTATNGSGLSAGKDGKITLNSAKLLGVEITCTEMGMKGTFIQMQGTSTVEDCTITMKNKNDTITAIRCESGSNVIVKGNTIYEGHTTIFVANNTVTGSITKNKIYSSYGAEIYGAVPFSDNEFFDMSGNYGINYGINIYDGLLDIIQVSLNNKTALVCEKFIESTEPTTTYKNNGRSALNGSYIIRATSPYSGNPTPYAGLKGALEDINESNSDIASIIVDQDIPDNYNDFDAMTGSIKNGKHVTINTDGKTLSCDITVNGTLTLTGSGTVQPLSTGGKPAITNKSANTVYINNVAITGNGSYPGVLCESGRVVIVDMPAGGVNIELTEAGDSVEMKTTDVVDADIAHDDAMVTSGSTTIFYFGLADALESAPANSTVKLTADGNAPITLTESVTLEGGITLDLNGHTVDNDGKTIDVLKGETVTVKSSIILEGVTPEVTIAGNAVSIDSTVKPQAVSGTTEPKQDDYFTMEISPEGYLDIVGVSSSGYKRGTNFPVEITVKSAYKNRFNGWDIDGQFAGTVDKSSAGTSISFVPTTAMTITAKFKAEPAAEELKLTPDAVSLKVGETQKLEANESGISWSTSDAKIATVNSVGLVTAVAEGEATITATGSGNRKATCAVTVTKADDPTDPTDPTGTFAGIPASYKIVVGFSHQLAVASPVGSKLDLAFISKNPAVCAIDRQGKITGVKAGKCLVGIKLNGKTYKSTVTVVANKFGRAKPLMIKGERGVFTSTRQLVYVSGGLGVEVYVYNRTTRVVRGFQNYALQIRRGDEVLHTEPLPESLSPFKKAMRSNTYKRYKTIIPVDAIEGIASKAFNLAQGELQAVIIGVDSNGNTAVPVTPATPGVTKPKAAEALAADEIK